MRPVTHLCFYSTHITITFSSGEGSAFLNVNQGNISEYSWYDLKPLVNKIDIAPFYFLFQVLGQQQQLFYISFLKDQSYQIT